MYNFDKKDELYLRKGELRRLENQQLVLDAEDVISEEQLERDHEENIKMVQEEIKELEKTKELIW